MLFKDCLILKTPWYDSVNDINHDKLILENAYHYIISNFKDGKINDELLELAISFLENNNIIFHANANYSRYQKVSEYLFCYYFTKKEKKDDFWFHKFCLVAVYSDYYMDRHIKEQYKQSILKSIKYFGKKSLTGINIVYQFLGYIHLSQYFLFQGDLIKNREYLLYAKDITPQILNTNLILFFQYHYSWSLYESGDSYNKALLEIDKLLSLESDIEKPITLHALNVKASILYRLQNYQESYELALKASTEALKVFSHHNPDVYAETLITMARVLLQEKNIDLALNNASNAIQKLETLFQGEAVDPSQALAHEILGDIYLENKENKKAENEYCTAKIIYERIYRGKVSEVQNYQLLSNKYQTLLLQ